MSGSLLLWLTLAMLVFWAVGLYNRLMRMRARAFGALGSVEKYLREYIELTLELTMNSPGESASQGNLFPAELEILDRAIKDARQKPLAIEPMARLQQALNALQRGWEGLLALPGDLAGPAIPGDMQARWSAIAHQIETARNEYNQILHAYNESIAQFPARLIVGLMGVKPGGRL